MPRYQFFYEGRAQRFSFVIKEQEFDFLFNTVAKHLRELPQFPNLATRTAILAFADKVPERLRGGEVEIEYNVSDWGEQALLRVVKL